MKQKSCEERIEQHLHDRIKDLETLFRLYQEGNEEGDPDLGTFPEYGLCFDYVPAGTFRDQKKGYFRYQLSWGGPSDEFRFITEDPHDPSPVIEYWFLDWFDGAYHTLRGKKYNLLLDIWRFFQEVGLTTSEYEKAIC